MVEVSGTDLALGHRVLVEFVELPYVSSDPFIVSQALARRHAIPADQIVLLGLHRRSSHRLHSPTADCDLSHSRA
jgi:hypothetical protein